MSIPTKTLFIVTKSSNYHPSHNINLIGVFNELSRATELVDKLYKIHEKRPYTGEQNYYHILNCDYINRIIDENTLLAICSYDQEVLNENDT